MDADNGDRSTTTWRERLPDVRHLGLRLQPAQICGRAQEPTGKADGTSLRRSMQRRPEPESGKTTSMPAIGGEPARFFLHVV